MKIVLHIERLLLDGLPVSSLEGARVRAAVERELAGLMAAGDWSAQLRGGAVPRVSAPDITLGERARPDAIGQQIAQSVHRGIGGGE